MLKTLSNSRPAHTQPLLFFSASLLTISLTLLPACNNNPTKSEDVLGTDRSQLQKTTVIQRAQKTKANPNSKTGDRAASKNQAQPNTSNSADDNRSLGTWILTSDHHLAGQLDGQRLVSYFKSQKKDIDQEVFLAKPEGVSLKQIKRVTFAVNQNSLAGIKNAAISGNYSKTGATADWIALVQFNQPTSKSSWQNWILPLGGKKTAIGEHQFLSNSSSKQGLVWISDKELLYGSESEIRNALENLTQHIETGKVARSIAQNQQKQLLYVAMDTAPIRSLVEELTALAKQFYPAWVAPYKQEIAAISGLEFLEFSADIQDKKFGELKLLFSENSEAKIIQTKINETVEALAESLKNQGKKPQTNGSLLSSFIPKLGSGNSSTGIGSEIQKLIMEIKDELIQEGTETINEEKIAGIRFRRPKKLDPLVTKAMKGFRESQEEWIRIARLQKVHNAISKFEEETGSLPKASFFPSKKKTEQGFSWRVAILPQLGYQNLYDRFNFSEPWNSDHNKKVAKEIPVEYCSYVASGQTMPPESCFHFVGGKLGLAGNQAISNTDEISDGADRTFMVIQSKSKQHWTEPGSFAIDDLSSLISWNENRGDRTACLLASGRIVVLPKDVNLEMLLPWFTPAGKERVKRKTVLLYTILKPNSR